MNVWFAGEDRVSLRPAFGFKPSLRYLMSHRDFRERRWAGLLEFRKSGGWPDVYLMSEVTACVPRPQIISGKRGGFGRLMMERHVVYMTLTVK